MGKRGSLKKKIIYFVGRHFPVISNALLRYTYGYPTNVFPKC